jgi:hypothetical protein
MGGFLVSGVRLTCREDDVRIALESPKTKLLIIVLR